MTQLFQKVEAECYAKCYIGGEKLRSRFAKPRRLMPSGAFYFSGSPMARSATFHSGSFGGDPLANLERSRAKASGKSLTQRELLEMGNRPLPESGRRTPDFDEWSASVKPAKHKPLEEFLAEEAAPKQWSKARQAAEALFEPLEK